MIRVTRLLSTVLVICGASLLLKTMTTVTGQPDEPGIWWDDSCGRSKFVHAGEMDLPPPQSSRELVDDDDQPDDHNWLPEHAYYNWLSPPRPISNWPPSHLSSSARARRLSYGRRRGSRARSWRKGSSRNREGSSRHHRHLEELSQNTAGSSRGRSASRIIGGKNAEAFEFPWQVLIDLGSPGGLCGGAIIHESWILTAAHCVDFFFRQPLFHMSVGEWQPSEPSCVRQIVYGELMFLYRDEPGIHDIALIKTRTPIKFDANVVPVCAPNPNDQYLYRKVVVSGWGLIKPNDTRHASKLQYTTMNTTTTSFCKNAFSGQPSEDAVNDKTLCLTDNEGGHKRNACFYDSGGPVIVKRWDGRFEIVGIVSAGSTSCEPGYPTITVRVGSYVPWITKTMRNNMLTTTTTQQ